MDKLTFPFKITSQETKKLDAESAKQFGIDPDMEVFEFSGYASTFGNIDRGGDIVEKGAFLNAISDLKESGGSLPVLWQHNRDMPVGKFIELSEDDKGLFVHGVMPKDDDFVIGRVMPQLKIGSVNTMSIGYGIRGDDGFTIENIGSEIIRRLKNLRLFEISLVTVPMNTEAEITDVKTAIPFQDLPLAARDQSWDKTAALGRVQSATDSTYEPGEQYKNAFLWYDQSDEDNFDAYKFQIADVIDGTLTAVPRAIFAAAAAMSGARGGVDIPDSDRSGVKNNINKHYKKMDLESPFDKSFRIDDISALDVRTLERFFKDGARFNNKTAKTIVSMLKEAGICDDILTDRDGMSNDDTKAVLSGLNKIIETIGG